MPCIEKITRQKRHQDRFNCFFDNGERLTVSSDMILQFGLSKSKILSASEFDHLRLEADYYFTREKAVNLLSMRDHSRRELIIKLLQKGCDRQAVERSADYLEERGYLNDERFASMFFRELKNIKRLGPMKIREKFMLKGVPKTVGDKLLSEYGCESQIHNCRYHFEKKKIHETDPFKYRQKMFRFLTGKGFDWDVIRSILSERDKL